MSQRKTHAFVLMETGIRHCQDDQSRFIFCRTPAMLSFLKQCQEIAWSSLRGPKNPRRRMARKEYAPETLELRILPAVVAVTLTHPATQTNQAVMSNVTVVGSAFADDIQFRSAGPANRVWVTSSNGTRFSVNGTASVEQFYFTPLNQLTLRLGAGNDVVVMSTNLPQIVIEDGLSVTETNTYTVNAEGPSDANGINMTIGAVRAIIDQGSIDFYVYARDQWALTTRNLDFAFLRTTRSTVGIYAASQGVLDVRGDVRVNSAAAASVDVVLISSTPNAKRDAANEGTLKVFGTVSVQLGGGSDTVRVVGTTEIRGSVNVDTGIGNDIVNLAAWAGGDVPNPGNMSPVFRSSVSIQTGNGLDEVGVWSFLNRNRIQVFGTLTIDTGNDVDGVRIFFTEVRGALVIDTGLGGSGAQPVPELAYLESVEVYGTSTVTMRGHGLIRLVGNGFLPTRFRQSVVFIAGAHCQLLIGDDNAASRIVFHKMLWVYGLYASRPVQVYFRGFVSLNPAVKYLTNAVEF